MSADYEMQMVKPLREPLEMDSSHFSTFELSLLTDVATAAKLLTNREHYPISPSFLLSTYSLNNSQDYPDTETAASLERTKLLLKLHSQSYTPPLSTASPSALQAYPGSQKEESLELLHLDMRSQSYSPTHSADRKANGQYTDDQYHHTQTVAKNLACHGCDKNFTSKKTLARHMKLHLNERNYECSFCKRKFNRSDYLKKHLNLHPGFLVKPSQD
jgi:uncharacterized Zn-finger protein